IVGATRAVHIEDAVAAADIRLEERELAELEGAYTPREPEGF
ncbi:aldo/keto reductase, partial [Aeromonas veronii]|nr:aldo/keto reductase [Aeromonas veronii]